MEKIAITTDQWIEIHKELRGKIPLWHVAQLKCIFEIYKNEKMISTMKQIKLDAKELRGEKE